MLKEKRFHFPQILRYPFFLLGLVIIIGGGVGAIKMSQPLLGEIVAIVGFVFLIAAVVFR